MDLFDGRTTMSTGTDNLNTRAEMPTELAYRAGDGIEVLLLWNRGDGRLTVVVDDLRNDDSFELVAGDGRQALDAFYHPFAYEAAASEHEPRVAARARRSGGSPSRAPAV